MSAPLPVLALRWDGEALVPRHPRLADRFLVVGQDYLMTEHQQRSIASHNHFFALVNQAYANLPEDIAGRWSSPEHLRKWAMIRAGYRDERSIVFASTEEAARVAAFVKPDNDYAVILLEDTVVTIYTAKSQAFRSMNRQEFQACKDAVLAELAKLIGVSPDTLAKEAGRDAA